MVIASIKATARARNSDMAKLAWCLFSTEEAPIHLLVAHARHHQHTANECAETMVAGKSSRAAHGIQKHSNTDSLLSSRCTQVMQLKCPPQT